MCLTEEIDYSLLFKAAVSIRNISSTTVSSLVSSPPHMVKYLDRSFRQLIEAKMLILDEGNNLSFVLTVVHMGQANQD